MELLFICTTGNKLLFWAKAILLSLFVHIRKRSGKSRNFAKVLKNSWNFVAKSPGKSEKNVLGSPGKTWNSNQFLVGNVTSLENLLHTLFLCPKKISFI